VAETFRYLFTEMNPVIEARVRAWIAALRSGNWKQGAGALRLTEPDDASPTPTVRHCCLGVACDISGVGAWVQRDNAHAVKYVTSDPLRGGSASAANLPDPVMVWYGLNNPDGAYSEENADGNIITRCLVDMNDTDDWTFDQIADVIEAQLTLALEGKLTPRDKLL
jgi:hypothetical protein